MKLTIKKKPSADSGGYTRKKTPKRTAAFKLYQQIEGILERDDLWQGSERSKAKAMCKSIQDRFQKIFGGQ